MTSSSRGVRVRALQAAEVVVNSQRSCTCWEYICTIGTLDKFTAQSKLRLCKIINALTKAKVAGNLKENNTIHKIWG